MVKKCIICGEKAEFRIKDCNDFYCRECAEENFADLTLLQRVEEEAQALKKLIENEPGNQDLEDQDI